MSVSPDPVEASAPLDPAAYRPRPLMGPLFWAMIALTFLCVIAGVTVWAVWNLGPRLRAAQAPQPAALSAAYDRPTPATPAPPLAGEDRAAATATSDVARISERLAVLERQQARTAQVAASALAAAAVVEAARGSGGFMQEFSALEAASPPSEELRAVRRLAQAGAPSPAALAASFPDYAARAAAASRAPGEGAGLGARITHALSQIVILRRVGEVSGSGPDAILAKAELQVEDGDIAGALRTLDGLPPASREALSSWRARAERRAELDRHVGALRAQALDDLARIARGGA